MVSPFDHRDFGTVYNVASIRLTRAWNSGYRTLDPELNSLFILELENYNDDANAYTVLRKDDMLALFAAFLEIYDSYGFENG